MKKLLILLLTLLVAVSMFAACNGDEPCVAHVDADGDNICDNCQADITPPTPPCTSHKDTNNDLKCDDCSAVLPITGPVLSENVIAQMEKAHSFKIDLTMTSINDSKGWDQLGDEEPIIPVDDYDESIAEYFFTVTRSENGGIRAKIEQASKYRDDENGEYEVEERAAFAYFIDGTVYSYDQDLDAYVKMDYSAEITEIEATLDLLMSDIPVDEAKKNEMIAELGEFALTTFNIAENKGTLFIDLKKEVNDFFTYVSELDFETVTLEDIIDDALALTDGELTAAKLESAVFAAMDMTVPEAVEAIDAWLTENYQTTLQGIIDTVIADPAFKQAAKNAIKMQLADTEGATDVDAKAEEMYNEVFGAIKIADLITANELDEVTLYELIGGLIYQLTSQPPPAPEELKTTVSAMLDLTVAQFEEMTESYYFSMIQYTLSSVSIDALDAKIDVNFNEIFNVTSISGVFTANATMTQASVKPEENNVSVSKNMIAFKLYDITETEQEIKLDGTKEVYWDFCNRYLYGPDGSLLVLNPDEDNVNLTLEFEYDGESVYVTADSLDMTVFKNTTVTVPGDKLSFFYNGNLLSHDTETELVVLIDVTNGEFTIQSIPEFAPPPASVFDALTELGCGEGVDNSAEYDLDPEFGGYFLFLYDSGSATIMLTDSYLETLYIDYYIDSATGNMICNVTQIYCTAEKPLYKIDKSNSFMGYTSEDLDLYLGGDTTFTVYIDADGVIRCDGLPDVVDEYKANS